MCETSIDPGKALVPALHDLWLVGKLLPVIAMMWGGGE